jgi:hypothetical protein
MSCGQGVEKEFDTSGKSPTYIHQRKIFQKARAGKPAAGVFIWSLRNRTAAAGASISSSSASRQASKRAAVRAYILPARANVPVLRRGRSTSARGLRLTEIGFAPEMIAQAIMPQL